MFSFYKEHRQVLRQRRLLARSPDKHCVSISTLRLWGLMVLCRLIFKCIPFCVQVRLGSTAARRRWGRGISYYFWLGQGRCTIGTWMRFISSISDLSNRWLACRSRGFFLFIPHNSVDQSRARRPRRFRTGQVWRFWISSTGWSLMAYVIYFKL